MRGRRPLPSALKILHGVRKSRINDSEPKPQSGAPRTPRGLDEAARGIWKDLVKQLHAMGTLSQSDTAVMEGYCLTLARMRHAEAQVKATGGDVVRSVNGHAILNPWLTIQRKAQEQLLKLAAELGLTPSSRTRIKVSPPLSPRDEAEKARFFRPFGSYT